MLSPSRSVVFLGLLAAFGCGSTEPAVDYAMIEGSVVWNGEPVSDGIVTFIPSESRSGIPFNSIPVPVSDGKYKVTEKDGALAGMYRVEVRAFRKSGKMSPEPTEAMKRFDPRLKSEELKEQVIPAEFNEKSTLSNKVAAGSNQLDFDLKGRELRPSRSR